MSPFLAHLAFLLQKGAIPRAFLGPPPLALSIFFIAPFVMHIVPRLVSAFFIGCLVEVVVLSFYWLLGFSVYCWGVGDVLALHLDVIMVIVV